MINDSKIVELLLARSELALEELRIKYNHYCHTIAFNILGNNEDCEECVNDAYLRVWNSVPPNAPTNLSSYIGKITRNLALDKVRAKNASRRGGGDSLLSLDELSQVIHGEDIFEKREDSREISAALNKFLGNLSKLERGVFMQRYWLMEPIASIALHYDISESKTTSMLHRLRGKLKKFLEKEGIDI